MKFSLATILFAAGIHAATLQARQDPGCPPESPWQVSSQIYLCCAYTISVVSYALLSVREGDLISPCRTNAVTATERDEATRRARQLEDRVLEESNEIPIIS
ncbi:hypothetical protein B0J12DRAFT_654595 [Macrophomina phaseolina]|uniref:Uncharacterized protein n=1 Tax=Macrophomina phaseolina TaxID=35725 RepID=A0ABQ8GJG7_9PEZI|nr:hypothetical protein B0J12DRAFT_654595 [Macrophomina phaseolina]